MTLLFVTPFFVAAGWVMLAPPGYYFTLVAVLAAIAVLPTSLAVILCMVLGVLFSAQRTRQGLLFVASLVFAVVFVLFRNLEPERFLNPDERAPLLEVLGRLQSDDVAWLPSTWAIDALWPYLGYAAEVRSHPVTLLLLGSTAAFFLGAWVFRALYRRAFSRAQEGIGGRDRRRAGRDLAARLGARLRWLSPRGPRHAILRKDFLVFVRDTAQWSQAFLIALLIVIYVVNFRYIRSAGESGIISPISLHFVNLALGGFVAVAVCVRFAFPSVSLEGRAFWLIACSPNRMRDFLRAKWVSLGTPLLVLVGLLVVVTSIWLGSETTLTVASAIVVVPLTVGLAGLGLGLGARYPRFGIDNAAKIAAGFGGVLYMFLGIALLLVIVIASIQPTLVVARLLSHGLDPGLGRTALAVALTIFCIGVPVLVGRAAVGAGARHLEIHGDE
jgi:ABC-2 type transport system permease protein